MCPCSSFFFNDTATTEIYTLSLHDALPILGCWVSRPGQAGHGAAQLRDVTPACAAALRHSPGSARRGSDLARRRGLGRSEEHTSELQSRQYLVCRLLLEKKTHVARVERSL